MGGQGKPDIRARLTLTLSLQEGWGGRDRRVREKQQMFGVNFTQSCCPTERMGPQGKMEPLARTALLVRTARTARTELRASPGHPDRPGRVEVFLVEPTRSDDRHWACETTDNFIDERRSLGLLILLSATRSGAAPLYQGVMRK